MSQLTVSEARALVGAQSAVREALRSGDKQELADAQARLEELRQELYEGDDRE